MPNSRTWTMRQWTPTIGDAQHIHEIFREAIPQHPHSGPELTLKRMPKFIKGIEEGALLAFNGERAVGAVGLSLRGDSTMLRMMGAVRPDSRREGIGRALLDQVVKVAKERGGERLYGSWFASEPSADSFMTTAGFVKTDRVFWSAIPTSEPLLEWALERERRAHLSEIRVISGTAFESLHPDWDHLWWRHQMEALSDVPSKIPFEEIPFTRWRSLLDPPFNHRDLALIALNGDQIAGMLQLREPKDGVMNIDYTGVARDSRRRGISVALKCEAIRMARALGVHKIITQNHENNFMFQLNMRFGFTHYETVIEGVKLL
jgi:GNAT superfamily N-acetyltransferase